MFPTQKSAPKVPNPGELRVLLYGAPKVGKSTFASQWPHALHLDTQGGAEYLETYRHPVTDWRSFVAAVDALERGGHEFRAVIVDTIGDVYDRCFDAHPVKQGSPGAPAAWARLNNLMGEQVDRLTTLGIGVILVAHERVIQVTPEGRRVKFLEKTGNDPIAQRFSPALSEGLGRKINGAVDVIARAWVHGGQHVLQCRPTDTIEAGDRTRVLPDSVPLSWDGWRAPFARAYRARTEQAAPAPAPAEAETP